MGFTGEPDRFFALIFYFCGSCGNVLFGLPSQNQSSRTVLIFTPQIRSALGRLGRFASKSGPASPRGFFFDRALTVGWQRWRVG